jgi:ribosomal protein S12 methylthiotransferase accessory factor
MGRQQNPFAAQLEEAAAILAGDPGEVEKSSNSIMLEYLGFDDGDPAKAAGRVKMLRAGALLRRLFQLPVPDAPGLVFFGGEADPAALGKRHAGLPLGNLAGSGLSPQRAFESCVGEGIEYLSQFLQPDDPIARGSISDFNRSYDAPVAAFVAGILRADGLDPDRPISWGAARRLTTGQDIRFPLDICYRRHATEQEFRPPLKLSSGCAAGATLEGATLRGLLELVERDAVAAWWRGGRRGRPISPYSRAATAATELLQHVRSDAKTRSTWLLDITTDIGIPVVAAMSARPDGFGFAVGFGARLTLADAACGAIFELCQAELGHHVVAAKRKESGDRALNDGDLRILRRSTQLNTRTCVLLHPETDSAEPSMDLVAAVDPDLEDVAARLESCGIAVFRIDLTRPQFGVPVVRVLAPALQLEPCDIVGARLAGVVAETGGGALHHGGLPLF